MKRIHYLFYKQHFCEWSVFNLVSCNTLLQEYYIYELFTGDMAKVTIEDNIVHTCMNLRLEKVVKETTVLYLFHFEEIKEIKYQIWKKNNKFSDFITFTKDQSLYSCTTNSLSSLTWTLQHNGFQHWICEKSCVI